MRRTRLVLIVLLVILAAASLSFTLPRSLVIVDERDRPIERAYVAYHYEGRRLNPAHSTTYEASHRVLVRSDSSGRLRIPAALHAHLPFPIETHPEIIIDLVYAPRLHNAVANTRAGSVRGVILIDPETRRFTMSDLTGSPERQEATLSNLSWVLPRVHERRGSDAALPDRDPATAAILAELIGHFRQEYADFLDRYRDVERPRPEMPPVVRYSTPDEQRRWQAMIADQFAKEPRWGALVERLYGRELDALTLVERELR